MVQCVRFTLLTDKPLNDATLKKLEFDRIREVLASYCACSLGKRLARTITPTHNARLVRQWLAEVGEMLAVSETGLWPPFGGLYDVAEHVRAASFAAPLEAEPLARVAETLDATATLRAWLVGVEAQAPSLQRFADQIADLGSITGAIKSAIDDRGTVRDQASAKLGSIRSTIEDARRRVRLVFDRILKQPLVARQLQYSGTTFHNDRQVLPLKAEYRGRIPGIIHRTSDSGATLFVEPAESVELNNIIVRLREDEKKEVTSILGELTRGVREKRKPILDALRAAGVLDVIAAKCRYARKRACICPQINDRGVLVLHEARHPLLVELFAAQNAEGKPTHDVVPIDVRLGDDFDILIVTGPNTGGKTVALKTIGLLALMTQCGIPIPAGAGSRMPVFNKVFIDIGDEQSLQQSLSTFSSHLHTLLEIIRSSDPRSLVLIDELGAGTDPDEGAAIGRALITELLQLGATAVVTTHLSALKAIAYTTPRVDNAAVEFDPQSLQPTYRLLLGEPGNSNAMIIAKRLGMPARLCKLAKGFLDDRMSALNQAIAGTLQSRRQAEAARRQARQAEVEAQRRQEQYKQQHEQLRLSKEAFAQWTTWISNLKPGDDVHLKTLDRSAKVVRVQLHRQRALVSAGAMDIEVSIQDMQAPRVDEP